MTDVELGLLLPSLCQVSVNIAAANIANRATRNLRIIVGRLVVLCDIRIEGTGNC